MRPPTDADLITLHAAAVALARSMRGEPDARRFVEGLSPHLREVIPHDRLLLIREDETPVPSPASWLTLPLEGVDRAIGSLAIAASAPATYTEAHATTARRIAEMLGPLVENMVLLQKERDRRRRMAVLPEVSRVIAGSLDVRNIFQELGAAVRTVLDFDLMLVRPIGASGTLQRSVLLVGDVPADLQPERRLEDYSFGARLAAKEIVLLGDARRELDQSFPGDRAALERGVRSVIVAPLVFGDTLGGVLAFAKHTTPTGSTRVTPRWSPGSRLRWWSRSSTSACPRNNSEWPRPSSTAAGSNAGWNVCGERSPHGTDSIASWGAPEPFARPWTRQPWSPGRRQRSCSRAKAGPGRSWSLAPSTMRADGPRARSWPSTAPHCPKRWRSPSSSDMSEERSPAPIVSSAVASRSPPAARSSSMRSAISPRRSRRSCSACYKNGSTNGSAARRRCGPMSGWSQPRTVISSIWSRPGRSARTYITGSRCSGFIFPRCGNVKETSSSSPNTSYAH